MSLLADLLSKVKQQQPSNREIPQNLKNIVSASAARSSSKKKLIIISIISAVAVAAGIIAVYVLESFNKVEFTEHRQRPEVARQPEAPAEKIPEAVSSEVRVQPPVQKTEAGQASSGDLKQHTFTPGRDAGERSVSIEEKQHKEPAYEDPAGNDAVDTHLYAAEEYERKKDYSRALSGYRKVLEIDRKNFAVMNNISYILLNTGSLSESIRYAKMSLDINKDYVPALINIGIASARSNDIDVAETYLNRAIALEPENKAAVFNLAVLYERQGKTEEALKVYERVLTLSADEEIRKLAEQRISLLQRASGVR